MSRLLIVVDRAKDWAPYYPPSEDVLTFDQYLQFTAPPVNSRVRVINLCQSARYLSRGGYYCSLLAEARGTTWCHRL